MRSRRRSRKPSRPIARRSTDFNDRLTERDESLEKWKSAYEEAANVARAKDAERAKFEGEATAFKVSTKAARPRTRSSSRTATTLRGNTRK